MMDEKKYTVSELLMYYVDRYRLTGDPYTIMTCLKKGEIEGYKTTRVYLERLLKKTKIGEVFLWDAVKQPDGVRRISISEFERLCFRKWAGYIQTRYPECDMDALQADIYRYNETYRWDDEARKIIEAQNRSLETGEYTSDEEDRIYEGVVISDAEVRQKGLEMMIEAIYDTLFDGFQWDKLRKDIELSVLPDGSEYNAEITGESLKAMENLKSYHNYVIPKK